MSSKDKELQGFSRVLKASPAKSKRSLVIVEPEKLTLFCGVPRGECSIEREPEYIWTILGMFLYFYSQLTFNFITISTYKLYIYIYI